MPDALTDRMQTQGTAHVLATLAAHESRNVTYIAPDGSWPIVWERARGVWIRDADGRRYLDLTAAFGVAAAGHANPRVVRAGRRQMARLLHAMGDVHPHALKAELARQLSRITFERWDGGRARTIFGSSGFEAVEAALKTARLATGRPGVIAFEGGYHGLGYGALNATHRGHFRDPFRDQLREFGHFVPFPARATTVGPAGALHREALAATETAVRALFRAHPIGAVLVEPVQARGGIRIPPPGFLGMLRRVCDENAALLILDEIYTGFGRTGRWFACEHEGIAPDVICLGKALTGGFPLSACVGRDRVMDAAWPPASGEAIHTSTFLGHPVGCAMALAQIGEVERLQLPHRASALEARFLAALQSAAGAATAHRAGARAVGLMGGIELTRPDGSPAPDVVMGIVRRLLHRGFILLPEGAWGEVIGFTPPLTIPWRELHRAIRALAGELARC